MAKTAKTGPGKQNGPSMFHACFDLPVEMHRELAIVAVKQGKKRVEIVREIIAEFLEKNRSEDNSNGN